MSALSSIVLFGGLLALFGCGQKPLEVERAPAPREEFVDPWKFTEEFRAAEYLEQAAEIQRMEQLERAQELAVIASDPNMSSRIFGLCRMLFVARQGQEFRAPMIGHPSHVADGPWPLDPIAIHDGIPILVATDYSIGGTPEAPLKYLIYCLIECNWSEQNYRPRSPEEIRAAIESFIETHGIENDVAICLRRQAQ